MEEKTVEYEHGTLIVAIWDVKFRIEQQEQSLSMLRVTSLVPSISKC